ncbi:MAG TPA: right-handed parallel beta-helix repeat-containing protein, partial [Thermoanaerobaculia bacterium]|nr:right-handed parallel beta-helix repeat-containing protein [Thermoanaerobaculia bacterium]
MPIDWFVAPTGAKGDGSRERPFHDPWVAFRRAEPGDTIHIAAGSYYGRLDRSSWIIEAPAITVLGGYSRDFATRTPWKTPSVLGAYSGYEYARENNLIAGRGTHDDLVLDGLCFDSAGRNQYPEKEGAGIGRMPRMDGPIAAFSGDRVTIRHCVFTNSASGGVELSGSGSRFENNLVINIIGPSMLGLRSRTQVIEKPIVVRGNSFVVMHDLGEPAGAGGPQGHGIIAQCPTVIENNLFYSCGNSGISNYVDPARIAIEQNVTFATPRDFLEHHAGGQLGEIKEKNLEELEDLGLKACAGNTTQDPAITGLPAWWVDAYTRDLFVRYKTPPREAANVLRAAAQLPALTPSDVEANDKKGGLAPRFPI